MRILLSGNDHVVTEYEVGNAARHMFLLSDFTLMDTGQQVTCVYFVSTA